MLIRVTLDVRADESGTLHADVVELPGCTCSGATVADLLIAADVAVRAYLPGSTVEPESLEAADMTGRAPRVLTLSVSV